ncbi:MAG: hypothetical protein QM778_05805 [Myxococcales bacterium]
MFAANTLSGRWFAGKEASGVLPSELRASTGPVLRLEPFESRDYGAYIEP